MAFQLVDPRGNGFAVSFSGAGVGTVIDLTGPIVPPVLGSVLKNRKLRVAKQGLEGSGDKVV